VRPGVGAAVHSLMVRLPEVGLPALVGDVRVPTLIVWGRGDRWIPVGDADRFAAAIPGSRRVVLENCGHVPQEERPAEIVHLLQEFAPGGS